MAARTQVGFGPNSNIILIRTFESSKLLKYVHATVDKNAYKLEQ